VKLFKKIVFLSSQHFKVLRCVSHVITYYIAPRRRSKPPSIAWAVGLVGHRSFLSHVITTVVIVIRGADATITSTCVGSWQQSCIWCDVPRVSPVLALRFDSPLLVSLLPHLPLSPPFFWLIVKQRASLGNVGEHAPVLSRGWKCRAREHLRYTRHPLDAETSLKWVPIGWPSIYAILMTHCSKAVTMGHVLLARFQKSACLTSNRPVSIIHTSFIYIILRQTVVIEPMLT